MSVTSLKPSASDRFANICLETLSELEKNTLVALAISTLAPGYLKGPLTSPDASRNYLQLNHAKYKNEVFGCLFLTNNHQLIAEEQLFFGTIDGASVHPRVVVQKVLEHNASAVIFWHNHPSGKASISSSDKTITCKLKEALALVDVRVIDHIVIGTEETSSFAEQGYL